MITTGRIHQHFERRYKDEYNRSDLSLLAKWLVKSVGMKLKGDGIDQLKNHWSKIMQWLHDWENS